MSSPRPAILHVFVGGIGNLLLCELLTLALIHFIISSGNILLCELLTLASILFCPFNFSHIISINKCFHQIRLFQTRGITHNLSPTVRHEYLGHKPGHEIQDLLCFLQFKLSRIEESLGLHVAVFGSSPGAKEERFIKFFPATMHLSV